MKRLLKSKIAGYIFLLCSVLFCIWCIAMPTVLVIKGIYIFETDSMPEPSANPDIYFDVYQIKNYGGVCGEVEITGLAYMETSAPNPDKKIDLYLSSPEHTYIVPTKLSSQSDITKEGTGLSIQGSNHSYSGSFSFKLLYDGIYDVILYDYENEDVNGYTYLNYQIQKTGREFRAFRRPAITSSEQISQRVTKVNGVDLTNVETIPSSPLPWHYVSIFYQDGYYLHINGWIAQTDMESKYASSYLAFISASNETYVYTTTSYYSEQLEEAVGSSKANYGFFDAYIPLSDFAIGDYTMWVLIQNPEGVWKPIISYNVEITKSGTVKSGVMTENPVP